MHNTRILWKNPRLNVFNTLIKVLQKAMLANSEINAKIFNHLSLFQPGVPGNLVILLDPWRSFIKTRWPLFGSNSANFFKEGSTIYKGNFDLYQKIQHGLIQ